MAYFDNSATTKPSENAVTATAFALTECWGNPSSLHSLGTEANNALNKAKKQVSSLLGCQSENFFFTSSGTAANNTAIFGAFEKQKRLGNRIVTTAIEHPSVSEPLKRLEQNGVEVIKINPDKNGKINEDEFFSSINDKTILVSCMAVNNEVGSIMPIPTIRSAVKRAKSPALIHTDCVQAFGKIPLSPNSLGADIITVSAHKIHGPKGIGGIYLKAKNIIKPYMLGGEQESNIFAGTQGMPAILGFGAAAEDAKDIQENSKKVAELKSYLVENIKDIKSVRINSPEDAIPYILNISILGLPSQPIVNFMSEKNILISAGSACKMGHRSPVLTAMNLDSRVIDSAVRISFSRYNTIEEVKLLIEAIKEIDKKYGKG
ncbi:MAG: cysteine desulfurase [Ruminococcaceae bacterium]|nr:cysteine desulfurase [Oscillospiraceae bacterium]